MMRYLLIALCLCLNYLVEAQGAFEVKGIVRDSTTGEALAGAFVTLDHDWQKTTTGERGKFRFSEVSPGWHWLEISFLGMNAWKDSIKVESADFTMELSLLPFDHLLDQVTVSASGDRSNGILRLRQVEDYAIYASKKNELIDVNRLTINKASNQSRQIYAKVSGLNIWESDGAGVQLGIGGRGLSPSRNSNFNTRQNGYDISADALGYPESYYTPPLEAIDRIEIVRGAASLQYGTQFGGLINFRFREGPRNRKVQLHSRQTVGSFGFFNSFNSAGGQWGNVNYYAFYQYKKHDGWRPNENLEQHTAYLHTEIQINPRLKIRPEYTHTSYLAQQPGGLTDAQFDEDPKQSHRKRNWFAVDWNLFALDMDWKFSDVFMINSRTFGLLAGRDALGNLDDINLADFGGNRDLLIDRFRNWGNETRLIFRYGKGTLPQTLLVGSRYYRGITVRQQGEANDGSGPDFQYLHPNDLEGSDFDLPSENVAFFAENVFTISEKWTLTPGIRFEYISTSADGYYRILNKDLAGNIILDEKVNESKSNNRSFVFFGLGTSYRPGENTELYANFSQNYRAINFNDIRVNVGSMKVDENLKDEQGYNTDLGVRGKWGHFLDFDISLYHLSYNDRIGTILKKEPNPVFNGLVDRIVRFRTNIADAKIYGIESLLEYQLMDQLAPQSEVDLSLFSNISFTHATYQSSELNGQDGKRVELVPPFLFKSGIQGQWRSASFSLQYAYNSKHFSDASNAVKTPSAIEGIIPAYQVVDLSTCYTFGVLEVEFGINNLLNAQYFTRRATGYPGPGIIPSQGRSFYTTLGVRI